METLSRLVLTFLLNALWQVILVTAWAAIAVRLVQRAPARYRHALWVMGLALAVLLPLMTLPDSWKLASRPALVVEITPPESAHLLPSPAAGPQAAPRKGLLPSSAAGPSGAISARGQSRFLLMNPLGHHSRSIALPPFFAYAALAMYLLSLFCHLTRLARAWTSTRQLRREARARALPGEMALLVRQCQAALGLGTVAIRGSAVLTGPATVGIFKPVIILPETLFQAMPSEELTSVLCHEMAHVRRRDYLLNLICEFVFLPLAFHPAAWLLKRRIIETRELACDEAAAGHLLSATAYARSLVSLAHSLAPLTALSHPRYTLGVFDANILEERIMRLLDKRPQVSVRRAKLLLGGATLALALAALTVGAFSLTAVENATATNPSGTPRDFSGRWELDKSQSDLPSPAPDNLVEVIEQHGSQLKVTTTSKDWSVNKPIAVTLFALLIPEFSTTTDNRETLQPFGPGQIRSKTCWEGSKLVTDWTLERDGQVAIVGRWIRHLSEDGKTQTIEITGHDPQHSLNGKAKVVFVKRGENPGAFLGPWRGEFQGKTYIVVNLKAENDALAGTLSIGGFRIDNSGQVVQVNVEAGAQDTVPIIDVKLDGSLLSFRPNSANLATGIQCQMRLAGEGAAELKCVVPDSPPGAPVGGWWKISRQSDDRQAAVPGPGVMGGVVGGAPGGVTVGTVGGVGGGVVGGVAGGPTTRVAMVGVIGGIMPGGSASSTGHTAEDTGTVSGTVFDPSGARVPQANVAILNKATSARESAETNDTGEFSFTDLPPGTYTLSVTKVGFGIYVQTVVVSAQETTPPLDIVLQPGDVLQAIDVTASRVPGAASPPGKSGPQRIRVGGLIQATKLVTMKKPDYPESARTKGIQGVVLLQAVISKEGVPLSLKVISSPDPDLSQAAQDAVHEWRYEPTLLNGDPIEVVTTVAVRFHLEG